MITALYLRISNEDKENDSISNQKEILRRYCSLNNFENIKLYIDDGYTGTNFDRPAFKSLIEDIESNTISTIIVKDLSRLGRNYIDVGYFLDYYFKINKVRFISVNDNIDSNSELSLFIPFKNVINEYYAKDISNKIRYTLDYYISIAKKRPTARPIYGYTRNGKIDTNVINNIFLIYSLYKSGFSLREIKRFLENKQIESPGYYFNKIYKMNYKLSNHNSWCISTIRNILNYKEYYGSLIFKKTEKIFKIKKIKYNNQSDYVEIENKIESIISKCEHEKIQKIIKNKDNNFQKVKNPYSKILFCEICGLKFRYKEDKRKNGELFIRLTCRGNHRENKPSIRLEDLKSFVQKNENKYKDSLISKIYISKDLTKYTNKKCLENNIKIEFISKNCYASKMFF